MKEQVNLMKDFIWLVDLKTTFGLMKYIVRVVPEIGITDNSLDIASAIESS